MTGRIRIAILDDYQNAATCFADWDSLDADVVVFTKPFTDADDVVRSLAGFDVLVAMRERTQFPAEVLEKLTDLRLLASTGPANAAIDLSAAGRLGITVCATGYVSDPTIEHTWALILAAARNLLVEAESMRTRGVAGHSRHGLARQDSRPARTRQSWVIGCPNRTGVRYDDDRVESKPDHAESRRARRASGDKGTTLRAKRRAINPCRVERANSRPRRCG